jgi:hypothetical protein
LAETDSSEGGAAAENQTELLKHEWHHSRGTSARRADRVHNPGESDMDIADWQQFLAAFGEPLVASIGLTLRAMPVAAGNGEIPITCLMGSIF